MAQPMYEITISNAYLGESKVIRSRSQQEAQLKANAQLAKWAERETSLRELAALEQECANKGAAARTAIQMYQTLLDRSLVTSAELNWESVYDRRPFGACQLPGQPDYEAVAARLGVRKKSGFVEFFSRARVAERESQEAAAQQQLQSELAAWELDCQRLQLAHALKAKEFAEKQATWNAYVDSMRSGLGEGRADAVEFYMTRLFGALDLYGLDRCEPAFAFEEPTGVLGMDVELPNPDTMPSVADYRFIKTRREVVPIEFKQKDRDALYEGLVFQTALSYVSTVFRSSEASHVSALVFNGWVHGVDRGTGKDFTSCLISVRTTREQFEELQLDRVDPKQCIRNLKGMFAPSLVSLAPVRPLMELNREDKRFVASRDVIEGLDPGKNLALMDWEDFEHLVRELFERVFGGDGGEVKVTQASRDQGVDAIAFDPDPIRGGKFVIQAKRYNNLVPVSAVRDLYGTMLNEGATKGILVTTAYYGPDAHEFAKDKPLKLIDGSELLGMLEQYGHGGFNISLVKGGPDGKANAT